MAKEHKPNMTGMIDAYHPNTNLLFKSNQKTNKEEYEKWNP